MEEIDEDSSDLGHGVCSVGPSDMLSSVSHLARQKAPSKLFVAQPSNQPVPPAPKDSSGSSVSNLYERQLKHADRPSEQDLSTSGLFKSFGPSAVVQGINDDSPRFVLDPAQKASLAVNLRAREPWKMKAVPTFRMRRFPVHDESEPLLRVPDLDPVIIKAHQAKTVGLSASDALVLSRTGENLDRQLAQVQASLRSGILAACAVQQGLGKMKQLVDDKADPAITSSLLQETFEASQDILDQLGRASAMQHYNRRLQVLRSANLSGSEFQDPMLRLPLNQDWLFGAELPKITEKCAAQKAVARGMVTSKPKTQQKVQQRTQEKAHQQKAGAGDYQRRGTKRKNFFRDSRQQKKSDNRSNDPPNPSKRH